MLHNDCFRKKYKIKKTLITHMKEVLDYKVVPERYTLKIEIEENSFSGSEEVKLIVKEKTKNFNFNALDLEISSCHLMVNGDKVECQIKVSNGFVDVEFGTYIDLKDNVMMVCEFIGKYSDNMWGLYKSMYNEDLLFSTDFEPTNARKAFPCWDQPDMKAEFDIAIKPYADHIALSNSSLKRIENGYYYFNTTPKMSTYIVAYISGKLDYVEGSTNKNIPIRVYAHKDEKEWGRYACDVGVKCLEFFEEYFGIEYPLPKLDMVSIPTFVSGAMENWGLVTYRKSSLLFNEKSGSVRSKKLIAETVCHELAHMWFGNLVTMSWWDDLWLNEGFATWAASLAMEHLPKKLVDWDVWTEFINSDIETGMAYDSLKSTHPICVKVNKPFEISQIFDSISYSKGSSMIKMLEGYIGRKNFRDGIRRYLDKHKYSNTTTFDLWNSFDKKFKVHDLMEDWINKGGFPLVHVTESEDKLVLTQARFSLDGEKSDDLWKIPVSILWMTEKNDVEVFLFETKSLTIEKKSNVYKINNGSSSFFRTWYPMQNLAHLVESSQCVKNRLNIINDICALSNAKMIKIMDVLNIIELYRNEANPEILTSISSFLIKTKSIFYDNEKVVKNINSIIDDVVGDRVYDIDLYKTKVDVEEVCRNSVLLSLALETENKVIIKKLKQAYKDYISKEKDICPEYKRSIFIAAADDYYEDMLDLYKKTTDPEDRTAYLFALSRIQDFKGMSKILMQYAEILPHEALYFFIGASRNLKCRNLILDFVIEEFDKIKKYFMNGRLFGYVVERLLSVAANEKYSKSVISVLKDKSDDEISSSVNKAIDEINNNVSIRAFNDDFIQ